MNRLLWSGAVILISALFLASCASLPDGAPSSGAGTGRDSADAGSNLFQKVGSAFEKNGSIKGSTPIGVWYEQAEPGGTLTISKNKIRYEAPEGRYTSEERLRIVNKNGQVELVTEEFAFTFVDMFYDAEQDVVTVHTFPHTDGDGGYHLIEFRRTPYEAPPAPVYGPAVDNSAPDAQKDFDDLTIRSMKVSFYDEGPYYDPDSSMAPELPYPDDYSYDLTVQEDGTALVSSSFCQEIDVPKEIVDELQTLAADANLGRINGVDIHTEDLPYGSPTYEAEITLASGEVIRSSANGDDVPEEWLAFQEPMHHLLFFAFMDAGYETSGEFHSTKPMKRVWDNTVYRDETGLTCESELIVPDWDKAFDYSLDSKYFVFHDEEGRYPVLMKTLDELSRKYKKIAEAQLEKDYEMMQGVPKSVWKKADRKYCYSLYAVDIWSLDGRIFSFTVQEGHSNSLGVGGDGYGRYRSIRYNIDVETGEILTLADLFNDKEALYQQLLERMLEYGTHNDVGRFIHSDGFPAALRGVLDEPEPNGIGCNIRYKYLELWMPLELFPMESSQLREVIYYEDIQDILNDKYASVK